MFKLNTEKSIFDKYIWQTSLIILSLILLVPILAFLITGAKEFLSPIHFGLALIIGVLQIWVVNHFKKELKNYWALLRKSFKDLIQALAKVKKPTDIRRLRQTKSAIINPWHREKELKSVAEGVDELVDQILDILEVNLLKEDLIRKLTTTLDVEKLSRIFVSNLMRNFNLTGGALYLKSPRGEDIELKEVRGFENIKPVLDKAYIEKLCAIDKRLFEENIDWKVSHGILTEKPKAVWVFPLKVRENILLGALFLALPSKMSSERERILKKLLLDIHTTVSLIFENALEHQKSVLMANFDPLTGAYNRREGYRLLQKILQRAAAEQRNVCIMVLDLDNFKKINDTYGHEVGDLALKEVVKAVRKSIRSEEDLVIRWGGEEFLVVIENIPPEKVYEVAERIRQNVEKNEIQLDDKVLKVTVSIGVACTEKEKTYVLEELFSIADKRLYKAKKTGKNRVVIE